MILIFKVEGNEFYSKNSHLLSAERKEKAQRTAAFLKFIY